MSPTFALLVAASIAVDEVPEIRPTPGQELVYRGRFAEESGGATNDRRSYDLEARAFVLQAGADAAEVAFLTLWRNSSSLDAATARLEIGSADRRGRVGLHATGHPPIVPINGPPSLEPAGFVELPTGMFDGPWDTADGLRPPREWRCSGADLCLGVRCLKLTSEQQSTEWRRPTAEVPGWRRTDTVWVSASNGMVQRLERVIERRGGGGQAGSVSRLEYERVESSTRQLTADLRREIGEIAESNRRLAALLPASGRPAGPLQFAPLVDRIDRFIADQPATPYRPALLALRTRADAGRRGETPPTTDLPDPPSPPPAVGRAAPDFLTKSLLTGTPMRLARWRGRPAVLLFVRPDSTAASATLRLASDLQTRYADRLRVAVLVVSDEEKARPSWQEFGVPLFAGRDAAERYVVNAASRVVVLDSDGVIRFLGDTGPGILDAVHRTVDTAGGR
jgi:hypothetical protein